MTKQDHLFDEQCTIREMCETERRCKQCTEALRHLRHRVMPSSLHYMTQHNTTLYDTTLHYTALHCPYIFQDGFPGGVEVEALDTLHDGVRHNHICKCANLQQ